MKATFENTVNILVKAYLNDTLRNQDCTACAVGNIIADANGWNVMPKDWTDTVGNYWDAPRELVQPSWQAVFVTCLGKQHLCCEYYKGEAKSQIDSTGYRWQDLARIESVFENNYTGKDPMLNSLMAVVDVLAEIHQVDLSTKQAVKELFVKQ